MMQKDIVGLLPPELSLRILSHLDADELLSCRLVSRTWAEYCDDQTLWHTLCRDHVPPIEPVHTTWNDVAAHRALLAGGSSSTRPVDESFEYDSEDDSGVLGATPAGSPLPRPLRRAVWERPSGASGVLPSYQRSPLAAPGPSDPFVATSGPEPPVRSHLVLPTAFPKANYKHLYLVRRILSRRMTDTRPADLEAASRRTPSLWEPDVQILTSGSSTALGGLPGHAESIYSLHLFRTARARPERSVRRDLGSRAARPLAPRSAHRLPKSKLQASVSRAPDPLAPNDRHAARRPRGGV
ncbi:f-box/wd-repeat protein lin-23 [Trichosporon asahii var. asahii CBS 8904]|uniref:F-box/wd-repeat protein lin-23 n=1 Tax=Trichosporon asahii var. asahii (strain CBS 8904) TaxID=1220162 RepID=K1VG27_TRIAC|nr:f-box/wd-repeat protein lin-23 [Trichosporon asahii var. asahii CBS 8904]